MVATVIINEKNGVGEVATPKTDGIIRFKNADDATVDSNNPMVIPGAGSDFSFDKWLRMEVTVAPDTQIENLTAYSDGSNGFGTGVLAWYKLAGTFVTPTEPVASAGYADFFATTNLLPADMDAINTGPFVGTGEVGDYMQLMLEVASTATQGALSSETITMAFDES